MPETKTCPVCGVKILTGIVGGDRVMFSAGPPGTRTKLYARVCRYVEKPGCINKTGGTHPPGPDDYYKADIPRP